MEHREFEQIGLDWKEEYIRFYKQQGDLKIGPHIDSLAMVDTFVPEAIHESTELDLETMFDLINKSYQLAGQIYYYNFYHKLIKKLSVLMAEEHVIKFGSHNDEKKRRFFTAKIQVPDEKSLYNEVYRYILDNDKLHPNVYEKRLPPHIYYPMVTFEDFVRLEMKAPMDERLRNLLIAAHHEYERYFSSPEFQQRLKK